MGGRRVEVWIREVEEEGRGQNGGEERRDGQWVDTRNGRTEEGQGSEGREEGCHSQQLGSAKRDVWRRICCKTS